MGRSVRGDSHRRKGLPNQDAVEWTDPDHPSDPVVIAIADGHGSRRAFRSDIGAHLGVSVATRVVRRFLEESRAAPAAEPLAAWSRQHLPRRIVEDWIGEVRRDIGDNPFTEEEAALLGPAGTEGSTGTDAAPELAYGATLLVAAAVDRYLLLAQLGDGDIVTVTRAGAVMRPIPPDPRLVANETTSLCGPSAERDFRIEVLDVEAEDPELVLLCTDGYSNSFVDEAAFLKVGTDLHAMVRERGPAWVSSQIPHWLARASREGSGDDVTLGVLWRPATPGGGDEKEGSLRRHPEPEPPPGKARTLRRVLLLFGTVLLGAIFGVASTLALVGSDAPAASPASPQQAWTWDASRMLVRLQPGEPARFAVRLAGENRIVGVVPVDGRVWVATTDGQTGRIYPVKFDDATSAATIAGDSLELPSPLAGLVPGRGRLWAISGDRAIAYTIDPRSLTYREIPLLGSTTVPGVPTPTPELEEDGNASSPDDSEAGM